MVKEKKKCSKEGCEKNSYCRGLCTLHYQELRRTVSLEPLYEKCGDQCKADGCVLPVYSKGLCNKHWQRFHKRGTWEDANLKTDSYLTVNGRLEKNQIITGKCSIDGCEKNSHCRGLCNAHYIRFQRYGDPTVVFYEKRSTECKVDGCTLPVYAKGLCNKHWQRFHKRGTWEDENLGHDGHLTVKERLEKNQIITENGCIEWTKQRDKGGYGVISINNYPHRVPRVSYETYIGPITPGLLVLHKCDNRACFNPDHLFLGTYQDNTDDMVRKGRNDVGEDKKNSKLTDDLVREIKTRLSNGETVNGIFPDYPVSGACLRRIRAGIAWKHITI